MGKHLLNEDIVLEEGDGLRKDWVIVVESRGDDPVVEDRVGQDIDEENFLLGNGEMKKVDGNFIGRSVED